jgi:vacuolar-type H+-ATPase subunit E/Vma4
MSLQAILDAIRASGEAQVHEIEARARQQHQEMLCKAQAEAERLRAEARLAALAPVAKERARITQRAQFEALQIVDKAREALVDTILEQARQYLATMRTAPVYPALMRRLIEEALGELKQPDVEVENARLEADPRDRVLVAGILSDIGSDLDVDYGLKSWGGVRATSCDGRVIVINTLEARFERAIPYLRRCLAALLEDDLSQAS